MKKKRVENSVSDVVFSKSVNNKFITVQKVVYNMLITCSSIPEFIALKQGTFQVKKSIENAKNRDFDAVNGVLFHTTVKSGVSEITNSVCNNCVY